jgi:hypothetical protein
MLTRVFGFGRWDEVALEPTVLLYEQPTTTKAGKDAFKVAYRASRRLVIRDQDGAHLCSHDGSAVGESVMPDFKRGDAHDMAIKTAESQALKRAAINLGDQFGLSLYAKGSTGALVRAVVDFDVNYVEPDPVVPGDDGELGEPSAPIPTPLSEANLAKFVSVCEDSDIHPDDVIARAFPSGVPDPLLDSHLPVLRDAFKVMKAAVADVADVAGVHDVQRGQVGDQPEPEVAERTPTTTVVADTEPLLASDAQVKKIQILMGEAGIKDRVARLEYIRKALGLESRPASTKNLTSSQAHALIEHMGSDLARADLFDGEVES